MRDLFSRKFFGSPASRDSWFSRIHENFRQLLEPARIFTSSANGAPLHLLRWDRSPRRSRAQSASLLTHAAIVAALAVLAFRHTETPPPKKDIKIQGVLSAPRDLLNSLFGHDPSSGEGSGGNRNPVPATNGNLVPVSSIQIVRPSLPPKRESVMPVPPTILDPTAPATLSGVDKIGLPWMRDDTNSPGPGDSDTIGNGPGNTMGDGAKNGPGGEGGSSSRYRAGMTLPRCVYCPDPQYTDEARKTKLQGRVTLRVLVGADGRTAQVKITQGIGMGLDERAVEAVRGWKFDPARDAARHSVAAWVTIEVVFRLI